MPETIAYILIALGLVLAGLLVVVLVRLSGLRRDDNAPLLTQTLTDSLGALRTELTQREAQTRQETGRALAEMSGKLQGLTEKNHEFQFNFQKQLNESMGLLREKQIETGEKQSAVVADAIGKMQLSNEKKLEEMRVTVDEKLTSTLSTRLDTSFKTVSQQLENVYKSLGEMKELSAGVTGNVTALNRVLTNVKARGTWAEVQLEGILDQTIPGMYIKNFAPAGGTERVEFAVKIPSAEAETVYLPVDSKFPMEDYVRLCAAADAADAAALAAARKALEERVYSEAKAVKKYIREPETTPFAILYLATEGLYAEIAASKTGLPERIQRECGVMIAGPTTVTALLNSFAMGFRTVAINEKANEIRGILAAAKAQYDNFGLLLDKAHKKIGEAGRTLEDAQKRNDIIRRKLKGVEALETADAQELLGLPESDINS